MATRPELGLPLSIFKLLLIFPAVLFMTALFLRNVQPEPYQPAHTAQMIVNWVSKGPVWLVLWVLLMALPLAVLVIGAATLLRSWKSDAELRQAARQMFGIARAHLATQLIAAATLTAGAILAIVALHTITD